MASMSEEVVSEHLRFSRRGSVVGGGEWALERYSCEIPVVVRRRDDFVFKGRWELRLEGGGTRKKKATKPLIASVGVSRLFY